MAESQVSPERRESLHRKLSVFARIVLFSRGLISRELFSGELFSARSLDIFIQGKIVLVVAVCRC